MMKRSAQVQLLALLLIPVTVLSGSPEPRDLRDAIVKIYTISDRPDYYNPWKMHGPRNSTGSGCVIKGKRILTNGHVVGNETFLQVRRFGDPKKYRARVSWVSHEADLALLTVDDPTFFGGIEPLEFGDLPETQEEVLVYGFPRGGDVMSTTKGVISRVEHRTYAHSGQNFLAGQIDAAINAGNSGGPVLVGDKIVGVVMQHMSGADNIGYMVPIPVISHFLKDIEDGTYDGFPALGFVTQNMENPDMKRLYKVPEDETGVLVTKVLPGAPAEGHVLAGDVLLSVAGRKVADDGTVEFRSKERTSLSLYTQEKQLGEELELELLRAGIPMRKTLTLSWSMPKRRLIPDDQYDLLPSYYIYGGVVFCPLTRNLLKAWGSKWYTKAPTELVAMLSNNYQDGDRDEIVLMLRVLAADVNEGYHNYAHWVITAVNGQEVRSLKELIALVEIETDDPFVVFRNDKEEQIILDRTKVAEATDEVLGTYRIDSDRSEDLRVE